MSAFGKANDIITAALVVLATDDVPSSGLDVGRNHQLRPMVESIHALGYRTALDEVVKAMNEAARLHESEEGGP